MSGAEQSVSLFLKTTTSSLRRNIAFVIAYFHIPKLQKSPIANTDETFWHACLPKLLSIKRTNPSLFLTSNQIKDSFNEKNVKMNQVKHKILKRYRF